MDDLTFFNTILPSAGLRCIAVPKADGKFRHIWGPDNAWLVQATQHIDATRQINVYFGCASYLTPTRRKQSNTAWMRSFWADLDVGQSLPGKPPKYATQKDAATAIHTFSKKLGLPKPFLVNSGWGVHAYWAMDADIEPSVWKATAQALKRALAAEGVLSDPSRTSDEASVLRPPGTHNRKATPRRVRLAAVGVVGKLDAFQQALIAHMGPTPAADPFAHMGPAPAGIGPALADLGAGAGYDPSSAYKIADACGVIGMVRDTLGKVDQPTWYAALGVLAYTIEAPDICHEWSKGDPRYTAAETDAKLTQAAEFLPTGCSKLGEQHADICKACPHFGKIKSPIVLGRERPQPSTVEVVERKVAADGTIHETRRPLDLPPGYGETMEDGRRKLTYTTIKRDKDGAVIGRDTAIICNTMFWAETRLWVDETSQIEWVREAREGQQRFVVAGSLIGKGGAEISGVLGENEIIARPGKERAVQTYMGHWLAHLTATSDKVMAYRSFGWADDKFILGDVVLSPNSPDTRAVLMDVAKDKQRYVCSNGDLATWIALVDRAYNAPGQEAFQFQIVCAFAAPLLSLMQQVKGVTVYSHSAGSGIGKTTVQRVGLSAWGKWDNMMLAQDKVTANALWGLMGAYNSLPIVYDELTNAENREVSELVFSVSSGRAKERMNSSGGMRSNNANWSTIMLASGNTRLSDKLAQHRANAEAEISRLFEFTLEASPHLGVIEANALFTQFDTHYGHAGAAFAKYVTDHKTAVEAALRKTQDKITTDFRMSQVERHWSALFSAVLVALAICRAQGLLKFDVAPVRAWMLERLSDNRLQRVAAVATIEEHINVMVNDLWSDMLVTLGAGDLRRGIIATVLKPPRGAIVGRVVRPAMPNEPEEMILSRPAINDWATKRGVSPKEMFDKAIGMGWVSPKVERHNLGKGTREYSAGADHIPCWKFNMPALNRSVAGQAVQTLTAVIGGKAAGGTP